ncbi:MAG TPA: D-alanyl-D-alanine carboxypeptidase, partial [Candidatus Kapabacteria bacterium]
MTEREIKVLNKLPLKTWIAASAALAVLTTFVVLSCGARKANSPETIPEAQSYTDVAQLIRPVNGTMPYIDTSPHPMHVSFSGWSGDTAKALNNLRAQIASILAGPGMSRANVSAKVVFFSPNDSTHDIYALDPNASVLPASTEKMFTSSTTLWALGSKYAFTTKLDLAPGAKISGSQINGNLYLRPSGDPTLTTNDLDDLADQIRAK